MGRKEIARAGHGRVFFLFLSSPINLTMGALGGKRRNQAQEEGYIGNGGNKEMGKENTPYLALGESLPLLQKCLLLP
jgi:hypothetical protein